MRLKCCSTAGRSVAPRATCGGGTCPRTTSGCWRRRSRFTAECPAAEYPPTAAAPSRRWPSLRPASGGRLSALRWPAAPRLGPSPADRLLWPTRWSDRRFCGTAAIGPPAGTAGVKALLQCTARSGLTRTNLACAGHLSSCSARQGFPAPPGGHVSDALIFRTILFCCLADSWPELGLGPRERAARRAVTCMFVRPLQDDRGQ